MGIERTVRDLAIAAIVAEGAIIATKKVQSSLTERRQKQLAKVEEQQIYQSQNLSSGDSGMVFETVN